MRRRLALPPLLVSVVVHVIVLGALGRMVLGPVRWASFFAVRDSKPVVPERIRFMQLPRGDAGTVTQAGRAGGDGRPVRPDQPPPPPLVAPPSVPTELPPEAVSTVPPREEGGTGPLVGGGGPTRGLRPTFSDPRLWARDGEPVTPLPADARQARSDQLDSLLARAIDRWKDSVLAANDGRTPRGWIYEKDGKKYGLEPGWIRLGKWSIPSAVLALLPLNAQGNPITYGRNAQLASMKYEIDWQANRAMAQDEFRAAVKALRERKDRERKAAEAERAARTGVVPTEAQRKVAPPMVPAVVPAQP